MVIEPQIDPILAGHGTIPELQLGEGASGARKGRPKKSEGVNKGKRAAATRAGDRVTRSRAAVAQEDEAGPSKKRQRTKAPVNIPGQPNGEAVSSTMNRTASSSYSGIESTPQLALVAPLVSGARAMEQLASAAIAQDSASQSNIQTAYTPQISPSLQPYPIGRTPFRYPCHHPDLPPPLPGDPNAVGFRRSDPSLDYDSDDSSVSSQGNQRVAGNVGQGQGRDEQVYPAIGPSRQNFLPTPSQTPTFPPHHSTQQVITDMGHHLPSYIPVPAVDPGRGQGQGQGQWQGQLAAQQQHQQTFSQEEVEANANAAFESISALLSASEYPGEMHGQAYREGEGMVGRGRE
ncbi:hypothetical protein L202_05686 [Cryptococcus amylolentus CBS 6039]|uniref:Uncharacterized protein n=1 Tax=Cryptococcus amylolentus CBS 6039 TaxID=1295533 RepID=A0A1E3HLE2_9TREE|nr:hypothetical protein L202_05686 [Cryptococcus amylolentus CBS 6039]ODN77159.1 hypothetical protein L202_05686 [Cryptococcus amylolentus CBS 6039]